MKAVRYAVHRFHSRGPPAHSLIRFVLAAQPDAGMVRDSHQVYGTGPKAIWAYRRGAKQQGRFRRKTHARMVQVRGRNLYPALEAHGWKGGTTAYPEIEDAASHASGKPLPNAHAS